MKKILIIEDDSALQQIYKEAFTPEGIAIEEAMTAKEGLEKAKLAPPDLIILDIMLPGGMNGFDALEKLKQDPKLKDIPVVILTNLDSEKDSALKIGAVDYIIKSTTSIKDVVGRIKSLLF